MPSERSKTIYRDFSKHAERSLGTEKFSHAKARATKEVGRILLAELRKKLQLNQTDVRGFRQADVSKIENRSDLKVSTLTKYVTEGLGLEIEIKARLVDGKGKSEEVTLFREFPPKRRAEGN